MAKTSPESTPTPKRPRKTKATAAEREAARANAKPIDPRVWMILGALILFIAAWTWLDPVTFSEAGQPSDQSIFQLIPLLMIRLFGQTPAVIILTIIGGIPFLSGLIGWLRQRFSKVETEAN